MIFNLGVLLKDALKQPTSYLNPMGDCDLEYNGNEISINGRIGKHPHRIIVSKNVVRNSA